MNTFFRVFSLTLLIGAFAFYAPYGVAKSSRGGCHSFNDCNVSCNTDTFHHNNNNGQTVTNNNNLNDCDFSCDVSCGSSSFNNCDRDCSSDCGNNDCDRDCGGSFNGNSGVRTIFVPRSLTTDLTLQNALTFFHLYHHAQCPEDRAFFHLQASYFHKESRHECELAGYFLPHGGRLNVAENGSGDINSLWLGLAAARGQNFSSTLSIFPKRKVHGGYFNFYFDLSRWLCGGWASVAFAAARVEHTLCLRESDIKNPGQNSNCPQNAIDALTHPSLSGARLYRRSLCETGVDDVLLRVGWDYFFCNYDHVGIYLAGVVPTGCDRFGRNHHGFEHHSFNSHNGFNHRDNCGDNDHRFCNEYLFEPRIGGNHGYIGFGLTGDYTLWECDAHGLNWLTEFRYLYGLEDCERRTFDLCGRPLSRYLQVVTADARLNSSSAVSHFTHNVEVTPRSTIDFWTALHYDWCAYNFEFGYNLWWRDCERVCLKRGHDLGVGILDLGRICSGSATSANTADISQGVTGTNVPASDTRFTTLTTSDLNVASGTVPSALTHKLFAGISWNSELWCMPVLLGFGGGYEFARDFCNDHHRGPALEQWEVWVRTAISF